MKEGRGPGSRSNQPPPPPPSSPLLPQDQQDEEVEREARDYQYEMLKALRDVNVDCNAGPRPHTGAHPLGLGNNESVRMPNGRGGVIPRLTTPPPPLRN